MNRFNPIIKIVPPPPMPPALHHTDCAERLSFLLPAGRGWWPIIKAANIKGE